MARPFKVDIIMDVIGVINVIMIITYLCCRNCNDSLFPCWQAVQDFLICCLYTHNIIIEIIITTIINIIMEALLYKKTYFEEVFLHELGFGELGGYSENYGEGGRGGARCFGKFLRNVIFWVGFGIGMEAPP